MLKQESASGEEADRRHIPPPRIVVLIEDSVLVRRRSDAQGVCAHANSHRNAIANVNSAGTGLTSSLSKDCERNSLNSLFALVVCGVLCEAV